jgi:hypothetical protein
MRVTARSSLRSRCPQVGLLDCPERRRVEPGITDEVIAVAQTS